jgi:hypothetical protein
MSDAKTRLSRVVLGAVLALAVVGSAAAGPGGNGTVCPRQRDACVDRLVAGMKRSYERLGCNHNSAFALLYLRTTESIRDAIRAGEFSDRRLWNQTTTAFGRYYLDAFRAWRSGHVRRAPMAWRIAFRAAKRKQVATLGDVFLGISAHVNRDLAFVYYRLGVKDHDDHLHVNAILERVRPPALAEIIARLDPDVAGQSPNDPTLQLDIVAWRELAWTNAQRLAAAPDRAARRVVAADIDRHSVWMARRIKAAFRATAANTRRDAFCHSHGSGSADGASSDRNEARRAPGPHHRAVDETTPSPAPS